MDYPLVKNMCYKQLFFYLVTTSLGFYVEEQDEYFSKHLFLT